ncbi:MAG: BatA domain-containing protein [Pirellulales bacterium]|nr:BatA domain-containing protein [Pirellulales bacterium]
MLFWTLGLPTLGVVLLPVLIHLINMMRHRRIEWAAMEFLLLSQKKHRTWVIFKQLLLLLLRMLALAAVVFLVAQPRLRNQWGNLLGGVHTHHVILLDDSYSMSDRWADTDAFAEAKRVVEQIGVNASRESHPQSFTLLRFSRAALPKSAGKPDMLDQVVDNEFADKLEKLLGELNASQTAAEPGPALRAVDELFGDAAEEQRIVYVISDFRARQWNDPAESREQLQRLGEGGVDLRLINCVDRARPNLSIESLSPAEGILAAGVPWFMDLTVRNYGPAPVADLVVTRSEDGHGQPSVSLAEIAPGKTAGDRFLVNFANAAPHDVTARLPSDAVEADNHRYATVDLPADLPVLVIDGGAGRDARYLSFALAPGESVRTGVRPQIETPRFLSLKPLDEFRAVNLANVGRLDASAVEALEKYVSAGGGLVFFLGDRTEVKFYNDVLFRGGQGLFPVPLARDEELIVDRLEPAPDLQVERHFMFRVFAAEQNPYLQTVAVQRYFALPLDWQPPADSTVRVVARLRNGAPLAVEHQYGKGRVMAFLTGASPDWNNWARNPSFVPAMLDLQAYLTRRPGETQSRTVGAPLELNLSQALYKQDVRFIYPEQSGKPAVAVKAESKSGMWTASLPETDVAGFYEARLTRADGTAETRRYAVNVDPAEGDLTALDGAQLAARLEGVKYRYQQAAEFQSTAVELAGYDLGEALLYALILLLIGEQILAWSCSYHPGKRRPLGKGGAA